MKYEIAKTVEAIYDDIPVDNPFISAMPDLLPPDRFLKEVASFPALPPQAGNVLPEERRRHLSVLPSLFVPMPYMYHIYDILFRAIQTTYTTRTSLQSVQQINALFAGNNTQNYATQADSGSFLGVPGVGKSSTIRRCLSMMPQVIEHLEYRGQHFYTKQVLYLCIECPGDCSVKTLAFNILSSLDQAIGSSYLKNLTSLRSASASAAATQIKILCLTHHVGVILVDEVQNAVETAKKNRQVKPLIKFLIELTNDTCTSIYFVGTPLAEELFISQEHLKRRTRGIRLLPLKPDGTYRKFLESIWSYQFTAKPVPLTDKLANKLYDCSGGIPAYIIKIFQESQAQAILLGASSINDKIIQRAIDILAIKVPKTYSGGTYISDFELSEVPVSAEKMSENITETPRLYANKRGRKATKRDTGDLLVLVKSGGSLLQKLQQSELLEVVELC